MSNEKPEFEVLIPLNAIKYFLKNPESISDKIPLPEHEKRLFLNKVADIISGLPENNYVVRYITGGNIEVEETKEKIEDIKVITTREPGEKQEEKPVNPNEVELAIGNLEENKDITVKLKPGTYYIGRNPETNTVDLTNEKGEKIATISENINPTVSRKHLRLRVTDDGRILLQDYGKEGKGSLNGTTITDIDKNVFKLEPEKEVELKKPSTITLGTLDITMMKTPVKQNYQKEAVEGKIKGEIRKIVEISKSASTKSPITEYIRASERIAMEAINMAKVDELEKYAKETGREVSIVSESAFTSLYVFILKHRDKLTGTLYDIKKNILTEKNARKDFITVVKKMLESVETYKGDKWSKNNKVNDVMIKSISEELINSDVFLFKIKEIAEKVSEIDTSNPDPVKVMDGYAETIKTVGIFTPVLTNPSKQRKVKKYLERLDKLLTGEVEPIADFEKPIVKFYKMSGEEKRRFLIEVSEAEKKRNSIITGREGYRQSRRRELNVVG